MRVVSCVAGSVVVVCAWSNVALAQNPPPAQAAGGAAADVVLHHQRRARATARTSADSPVPTRTAQSSPLRRGRPSRPDRTWRAYLSGTAPDGRPINARDRIGTGPWHNAKGAMIAATVPDLHGEIIRDRNQVNKLNALTEKGAVVNGAGDTPNVHDILTGSDANGRALPGRVDTTCENWTSNAATGSAFVGHHDRTGGGTRSWNSAHASRGCGQANLVSTGGAGLFYCFAAN